MCQKKDMGYAKKRRENIHAKGMREKNACK
jgi:hypothetical protein